MIEYGTDMMVLVVVVVGEGLVLGCDGVVGLGDLDGVVMMGEEGVCAHNVLKVYVLLLYLWIIRRFSDELFHQS